MSEQQGVEIGAALKRLREYVDAIPTLYDRENPMPNGLTIDTAHDWTDMVKPVRHDLFYADLCSLVAQVEQIITARVADALARYSPAVWESGRTAGVIDALRAHGPSDEQERLLWVVMTPPTEENPYEGAPFDFEAHEDARPIPPEEEQ